MKEDIKAFVGIAIAVFLMYILGLYCGDYCSYLYMKFILWMWG